MQDHPAADGEETESNSVRESEPGDTQTEDDLVTSRLERTDEFTDVEEVVEEDVEEDSGENGGVEPADSDNSPRPDDPSEVEDDDVEEDEEEDDVVEEADATDEEVNDFEEDAAIERSIGAKATSALSEKAEANEDEKGDAVGENASTVDEKSSENDEEDIPTTSTAKESIAHGNGNEVREENDNRDFSIIAPESMVALAPSEGSEDRAIMEVRQHVPSSFPTTSISDTPAKAETVMQDQPMSVEPEPDKKTSAFGQAAPHLFGISKSEQDQMTSERKASFPWGAGAQSSGDVWKSDVTGANVAFKPLFGSSPSFGAPQIKSVESEAKNLESKPVKTPLFGLGSQVTEAPVSSSLEKKVGVADNSVEVAIAAEVASESKPENKVDDVDERTRDQPVPVQDPEPMSVTDPDSTSREPGTMESKGEVTSSLPLTSNFGAFPKPENSTPDNSVSDVPASSKKATVFGQAPPSPFGNVKVEQGARESGFTSSMPWGKEANVNRDVGQSAVRAALRAVPKPLFGNTTPFGAPPFKPAESKIMNKATGIDAASGAPKPSFGSVSPFGAPQLTPAESKTTNLDDKGAGAIKAFAPSKPVFGSTTLFGASQSKRTETQAISFDTGAAAKAQASLQPKPLFGSSSPFVAPAFKPVQSEPINLDTNAAVKADASAIPKPVFGSSTSFGVAQLKAAEGKGTRSDSNAAVNAEANLQHKPVFGSESSIHALPLQHAERKAMNVDEKTLKAPLVGVGAPVTEKLVSMPVEKNTGESNKAMENAGKAHVGAPVPDEPNAQKNEHAMEEGTDTQEFWAKTAEPMTITKPIAAPQEPSTMKAKESPSFSLRTTSAADIPAKAETDAPDHRMSTKVDSANRAIRCGKEAPPVLKDAKPEESEKAPAVISSCPRDEAGKGSGDMPKSAGTSGPDVPAKPLFGSTSSFVAPQLKPVETKMLKLDAKAVSPPLFGVGAPVTKKPVSFSAIPSFQTTLSPGAPNFVPGAAKHPVKSLSAGNKSLEYDIAKKTTPMDSARAEKPSKEWSNVFENISLSIMKRSSPEVKKTVVVKKEGTFKLELFKDKNGTFLNVVRTDAKEEELYLSLKVGADVLKCVRIKGRPDRLSVTRIGNAAPKVTTEADPTKFFPVFPTEEECSSLLAAFSRAIAEDVPSSIRNKSKPDPPTVKVHETPTAKAAPAESAPLSAKAGKSNAPVPTISKSKLAAKKRLALQKMQLAKKMKMKGSATPSSASVGAGLKADKPPSATPPKLELVVPSVETSALPRSSNVDSGNGASLAGAKRQAGVAFESAPHAKKKKKEGESAAKQHVPPTSSSGKKGGTATPMEIMKPDAQTPVPEEGPSATKAPIPQVPVRTTVGSNVSTSDEAKLLRKQLDELSSKYHVALRNAKESELSSERKLAEALEKQSAQEGSLQELARNLESMETKSAGLAENCDKLSRIADEVLDSAIDGLGVVSSRLKGAIARGSTDAPSSLTQCRPHSADDFLDRLWSFQPSTWYGFVEKELIDPVECALRGWYNSAPNQLKSSDGAIIKFDVQTLSNPELYDKEINRVRELILGKGHALLSGWLANSCPNEFRTLTANSRAGENVTGRTPPQWANFLSH